MNPRRLAFVLTGLTIASTYGCGNDKVSDREAVRGAVRSLIVATVNEDDAKACSLLTEPARRSFVKSMQRSWRLTHSRRFGIAPENVPPAPMPRTCAQARAFLFRAGFPAEPQRIARDPQLLDGVKTATVTIRGDRATVTHLESPLTSRTLRLVKTPAGWRFTLVRFDPEHLPSSF